MKTRTGERRLFLDTICLKCQGSWERGGGQRVTKQETINSYLRALPCSDPSPSSQLLIDQLVDTCPVQPGCLPTSTDQPRESKNSRKCGWTFLEDSTFFKIWKAQQASVMRGIHEHIKKKKHKKTNELWYFWQIKAQFRVNLGIHDHSENACSGVGWLDWLALVCFSIAK